MTAFDDEDKDVTFAAFDEDSLFTLFNVSMIWSHTWSDQIKIEIMWWWSQWWLLSDCDIIYDTCDDWKTLQENQMPHRANLWWQSNFQDAWDDDENAGFTYSWILLLVVHQIGHRLRFATLHIRVMLVKMMMLVKMVIMITIMVVKMTMITLNNMMNDYDGDLF